MANKTLKTEDKIRSSISNLRATEKEINGLRKEIDDLSKQYTIVSDDKVDEVKTKIGDNLNKQRFLNRDMQRKIEETYDDIKVLADDIANSMGYITSFDMPYAKSSCCGDVSTTGHERNKIDNLENCIDAVFPKNKFK